MMNLFIFNCTKCLSLSSPNIPFSYFNRISASILSSIHFQVYPSEGVWNISLQTHQHHHYYDMAAVSLKATGEWLFRPKLKTYSTQLYDINKYLILVVTNTCDTIRGVRRDLYLPLACWCDGIMINPVHLLKDNREWN